jgi:hypothetical protein
MKKRIICFTFVIFALGLLIGTVSIFAAEETSSMTCDNGIVNMGDDKFTVQNTCGIADSQNENEWVYNFGPSEPAYTVIFKEGKVVRILQDEWGS